MAQELFEKCLNARGYKQSKYTAGLWKYKKQPIQLTLVSDDFRIKYTGKENAII